MTPLFFLLGALSVLAYQQWKRHRPLPKHAESWTNLIAAAIRPRWWRS